MSSAARVRTVSLVVVGAFLVLSHGAVPDPRARAEFQYHAVITLGWGHLLAALGRPRRRGRAAWSSRVVGVCVASWAFALYARLLASWPGWVLGALTISAWHTLENERALAQRRQGLALDALPRRPRDHLLPIAATAAVGWLAMGTSEGAALVALGGAPGALFVQAARATCVATGLALAFGSGAERAASLALVVLPLLPTGWWSGWLRLSDVFVVVTLHHLVSWLLVAVAELRCQARRGAAGALARWLVLTHLIPLVLCIALLASRSPSLDPLRAWLLAPGVYLFWSTLHALQTAWRRGIARPLTRAPR